MKSDVTRHARVGLLLSLGIFAAVSLPIFAQTIQGQQASGSTSPDPVLSSAVEIANSICQTAPLEQSKTVGGGKAQAEVPWLARFLNLGAGAEYRKESSSGVSQQDLARAIESGNKCKTEIVRMVLQHSSTTAAVAAAPAPAPTHSGEALAKDDLEAARLYKLLAVHGYAFAQNNLGVFYAKGRGGLPKDDREAARLYKLAADQGSATAQNNLGGFYAQGRGGLPKDEREAARLYKLAADQGNAAAQEHLGYFYAKGRGGLPKDEREAARLYKLAADQGNAAAQRHLARLLSR